MTEVEMADPEDPHVHDTSADDDLGRGDAGRSDATAPPTQSRTDSGREAQPASSNAVEEQGRIADRLDRHNRPSDGDLATKSRRHTARESDAEHGEADPGSSSETR